MFFFILNLMCVCVCASKLGAQKKSWVSWFPDVFSKHVYVTDLRFVPSKQVFFAHPQRKSMVNYNNITGTFKQHRYDQKKLTWKMHPILE